MVWTGLNSGPREPWDLRVEEANSWWLECCSVLRWLVGKGELWGRAGPPLLVGKGEFWERPGPGEWGLEWEGVLYWEAEDSSLSLLSSVRVIRLLGLVSLLAGLEDPLLGPAECVERLLSKLSRSVMFFLMDCWVLEVVVSYLSVDW